jgi:hypothetical protein
MKKICAKNEGNGGKKVFNIGQIPSKAMVRLQSERTKN